MHNSGASQAMSDFAHASQHHLSESVPASVPYPSLFSSYAGASSYVPLIYPNGHHYHSQEQQVGVSASSAISDSSTTSANSQSDTYSNESQQQQLHNSGAFLRYTKPSVSKPENVCSWIDPDTKQMCNRVFYRMDEIGNGIWRRELSFFEWFQ